MLISLISGKDGMERMNYDVNMRQKGKRTQFINIFP
jgi:hypothetical protein